MVETRQPVGGKSGPEEDDHDPSDHTCEAQCNNTLCPQLELPSCLVTPMRGIPPHPVDGFDERCCPGFWLDENSIEAPKPPPIPVLNWVFDPCNRYLNDNRPMRLFGNMGTRWADAHRKQLMGLALLMTVCSIPVAIMGCFGAGSNDREVVTLANWAFAWVLLNDTSSCYGQTAEIGLRTMVLETCEWDECREDTWDQRMTHCEVESVNWDRAAKICDGDDGSLGIFECETVNGCHLSASGGGSWAAWVGSQQQSAYVTCFTLIFALMGCLTRIRWRQDTNFQKLIGCLPDTLTAVTGSFGLYGFISDCYGNMDGMHLNGRPVNYRLGVGYKAFWCCWAAQVGRALLHWIVPVPGGGGGLCSWREPAHAARLLEAHGTASYRAAHQKAAEHAKVAPAPPQTPKSGCGTDTSRGMARVLAHPAHAQAAATWEEPIQDFVI